MDKDLEKRGERMRMEKDVPFEVEAANLIKRWVRDQACDLNRIFEVKANECFISLSSIPLIENIPGFEYLSEYEVEKLENDPRVPREWGRIKTEEGYLTVKIVLGET